MDQDQQDEGNGAMECGDGAAMNFDAELAEEMEDAEEIGEEEVLSAALDNSKQTFSGHNGKEVYCVNMHPVQTTIAVSGGLDDKAYIWNIETAEVLFECSGHKDSVVFADFNKDGTLLATADMGGFIQVWKMETRQCIWSYDSSDLEWTTWHPLANVLLAGFVSGEVWMWKVPSGDLKVFPSPSCRCTSGAIHPEGKTAVFGYEDGSVRVYDLKTSQIVHSFTKGKDSHNGEVNNISYDQDGSNFATAGSDGWSKIINTTTGKMVASYKVSNRPNNVEGEEHDFSIECASLNSRFNLLAFGSLDCNLYIWNLRTKQIVKKIEHPDGITKIIWDQSGSKIFTACLDGNCRLWNGRSGECIHSFFGAEGSIMDISVSKDEKWLLSASADGDVRSYALEEMT